MSVSLGLDWSQWPWNLLRVVHWDSTDLLLKSLTVFLGSDFSARDVCIVMSISKWTVDLLRLWVWELYGVWKQVICWSHALSTMLAFPHGLCGCWKLLCVLEKPRPVLSKRIDRVGSRDGWSLNSPCWWYDCIASYAHTGTLFAILPMFPRRSDYAATSTKSRILCFLLATFFTTGLTHWLRAQIYQSNDYVSQKLDSTHSSASTTCIRELCTSCDFAPFCDFCAFLRFWSDHTSEACPGHHKHRINHIINSYHYCHVFLLQNAIVSIKSTEVRRTSTQAHQIWKSSDPTSYSIHPHASVISLENSETRSNLFYLLIKLIVFVDGTYDHGVCAFILPPFIHIFVV